MPKRSNYPKQVSLRLENDLFEILQADADANGRTVGQTIRFHLRRALAQGPAERDR
jgi:hypothetical protein